MKPILIASASFDEHAYGPVSKLLVDRGYPVVVYKTDKLLSGDDRFILDLRSGSPTITYNGAPIDPESISAAWYRKVGSFSLPDAATQLSKQLHMNNEIRALHDTIWPQFYPECLWLSAPSKINAADRKLGQLLVARKLGFSIPETIVTSDWESVESTLLAGGYSQIIIKMMRGVISENNQIKAMPTTVLDGAKVRDLKRSTSPFPGIFQPFVKKGREWRVTVVGVQVFAAAIYTSEDAKDDWRIHQDTDSVRFEAENLPDDIADRCIRYLQEMNLGYGAFDLIEKPDGEIVFLECNPNGQYGWLEEDLSLPISSAIADELIAIAERNG